jgi:hypothetical protein
MKWFKARSLTLVKPRSRCITKEVVTRFRVKHVIIKNTTLNIVKNKPWFAQKIQ